jgi:hypothetical protein
LSRSGSPDSLKQRAHIYHIGVPAVKKRKLNLKMKGFEITDPAIHLEDVIDKL